MLSQDFIQEMQTKLLQEQETLKNDLAGLSQHSEVGDDLDENATELQMDEVNQDVSERMRADLVKIETALEKIEAGTYGIAEDGQEISEDRLRVIPWADTAI